MKQPPAGPKLQNRTTVTAMDPIAVSHLEAAKGLALQLASRTGRKVYMVGGQVRDRICPPVINEFSGEIDIDLVTGATPQQIIGVLPYAKYTTAVFPRTIVSDEISIATFRGYVNGFQGGFPPPMLNDLPEQIALGFDAQGRDFTVNALYEDIETGEILDPLSGLKDAEDGVLRACASDPAVTFMGLKQTMMRAIRFACNNELILAPEVANALYRCSKYYTCIKCMDTDYKGCPQHQGRTKESLWFADWPLTIKTLLKTMGGANPGRAVRLLRKTGLLRRIAPELITPVGGWSQLEFALDTTKSMSGERMLASLINACTVRYGRRSDDVATKVLLRFCLPRSA